MQIEIASSVSDFPANEWNRLAGDRFPFLRHEFLHAAEWSGSAAPATGWTPRHIGLRDRSGRLKAVMPLYEKVHSWGEFVFDWSWAQAYQQAGFDYYPKLVSAVPFTPATSSRLLVAEERYAAELVDAARQLAADERFSSLHILFPPGSELRYFKDSGFQLRKDCQFHWRNRNYRCFDDFLEQFSSSKRKKVRRDRRRVREQGITFRRFKGTGTDAALWRDVYELISMTFLRRGSMPYFSLDFFVEIARQLPDNILVIMAELNRQPIAAAVFYDTDRRLYGRYWGADSRYDALHFETCYYQGIEYCIEHDRQVFEPGTQGEHKISRGFEPTTTWSAHWLLRPEFYSAVERYLQTEANHIDAYIDAVKSHSPYKSGRSGRQTR